MRKKNRSASISEEYISSIREKRRRLIVRKKRKRLSIIVVMAVCVVISSILIANHGEQKQVLAIDNPKETEGKAEINNLVEVEKDKNVVAEKNERETENNKQAVSDKTISKSNEDSNNIEKNYSKFFKKDIFLGDSITEGMSDYDFLEEANVCAKLGVNLTKVDELIEKAKNQQPEKIFLLLGANDLEYGGTTPELFKDRYKNVIHKVKASIPNSKIYVQSILPVLPQASRNNSFVNNSRIGQFNTVIKAMASEENITYLNIASLINDSNKNLYEQDGIHFKSKFYTLWLNYIELNAK